MHYSQGMLNQNEEFEKLNSSLQLQAFSLGSKLKRVKPLPGTLPHAVDAWHAVRARSAVSTPYLPPEHVLRKIHHCTFLSQTLDSNFWTTFFTKKFLFLYPNFRTTFFCHCANSLSSLHIWIHHCTFCASLHVKTSPASLTISTTNTIHLNCLTVCLDFDHVPISILFWISAY